MPLHGKMNKSEPTDLKSIVMQGFKKSIASLLVKIVTAGLTYLMFVILSRTMSEKFYGQFAFGFALATILAVAASAGQEVAILRFWPEEIGKKLRKKANEALSAGWALVIIAGIIISLSLIAITMLFNLATSHELTSLSFIMAAASLILPLAMAEYGSSALRAQGSVWAALTPRDILWKASVPIVVWVLFFYGIKLNGTQALLLASFTLSLAMIVQFMIAKYLGYQTQIHFSSLKPYIKKRGKISFWFLISTLVDTAALNIDIVLVGLLIASESAGLYFNAFRTAGLITLFMYAITLVIAPMVSRHFHAGEIEKAQAVTSLCTWAGFIFSLGIFTIYLLFGDLILSLFGASYAEGKIILLLLSAGLLVDAATGPTRIVMVMTGHERQYVAIFGSIMLISFAILLIVIPIYGIIGAAIVNMIARIIAQSAIAIYAKKKIGLNTSIWGFGGVNFKELAISLKQSIKK